VIRQTNTQTIYTVPESTMFLWRIGLRHPHKVQITKKKPNVYRELFTVCAYHCAQLSYTTQQGSAAVTFALDLNTNIIVQMLSISEQRENDYVITGMPQEEEHPNYAPVSKWHLYLLPFTTMAVASILIHT